MRNKYVEYTVGALTWIAIGLIIFYLVGKGFQHAFLDTTVPVTIIMTKDNDDDWHTGSYTIVEREDGVRLKIPGVWGEAGEKAKLRIPNVKLGGYNPK